MSNLAQYFATLPGHRWNKRVMAWQPQGRTRIGRPKYCWDSMITNFCRLKNLPSWGITAIDPDLWCSNLPDFVEFCNALMYIGSGFTIFPPVPETGCPMGHTGLTVDRDR